MKALMFISILAPFPAKCTSEALCLITFLVMPSLYSSWCLPSPDSLDLMSDKLSSILIMLSLWTSILMSIVKQRDKFLSLNIIFLLWSLVFFFSASSLLLFFVLFEASLIPTLCLIMGWGYQPERLEAAYYFIFYTITLSIPLLASLIWLISSSGMKYFYFDDLHEVCSSVLGFLILIVFMIKLPLFMTHFWLPKAHVEAPVVGSMILAGVLLKTGGYGIIRVFSYMYKTLASLGFMVIGMVGMAYVCLVCLYCTDIKQMIAFSSVSHMNFMIMGLMNNSQTPFSGSLIMMVSHGLCSSMMFMLADLSYKRCGSRSVLINKGLLLSMPSLALFWGISVLLNMGIPPSAGSISELMIIASLPKTLLYYSFFGLYLFFSAFYSVYLYMIVNHGNSKTFGWNLQVKESFLSTAHLGPLLGLVLATKLMLM